MYTISFSSQVLCNSVSCLKRNSTVSFSVFCPVVGCGERRGPADLLSDGKCVEEDPRLVWLLHLRHDRQHRHPLHPAEGGVTTLVWQKKGCPRRPKKKKKKDERNKTLRSNQTKLTTHNHTLFRTIFPLHSYYIQTDTSQQHHNKALWTFSFSSVGPWLKAQRAQGFLRQYLCFTHADKRCKYMFFFIDKIEQNLLFRKLGKMQQHVFLKKKNGICVDLVFWFINTQWRG